MKTNFKAASILRPAKFVLALGAAAGSNCVAYATCWRDSNVNAATQSIAHNGFPNAASRMPSVLVCEGADFGPNIGGDYTGGIHQIRIPQWQLGRPELHAVLAHELAHAETWLTGGSEANNGHSADFMRALLRAGWRAEAQRVAHTVAGAQYALRQAEASLQGQLDRERPPNANTPPTAYAPPIVMTQVCHDEQIAVYHQIMPGRYHLGFVIRRTCQWVPVQ